MVLEGGGTTRSEAGWAQTELASSDVQPAKGWLKAWPCRLARKASRRSPEGRSRLITVASGCRTCEELAEWNVTVIAIAFTIALHWNAITDQIGCGANSLCRGVPCVSNHGGGWGRALAGCGAAQRGQAFAYTRLCCCGPVTCGRCKRTAMRAPCAGSLCPSEVTIGGGGPTACRCSPTPRRGRRRCGIWAGLAEVCQC